MRSDKERALKAFEALCEDVEQFDEHPFIEEGSDLFSNRVPLYMRGYLVNWLREFARHHAKTVRAALADEKADATSEIQQPQQ